MSETKTNAQRAKKYRETHPEKVKEMQRRWYEKNKHAMKERKARAEKILEYFDDFTDDELEKARDFILEERQK